MSLVEGLASDVIADLVKVVVEKGVEIARAGGDPVAEIRKRLDDPIPVVEEVNDRFDRRVDAAYSRKTGPGRNDGA